MVTKRGGDDGKWCGREAVTKASGELGSRSAVVS